MTAIAFSLGLGFISWKEESVWLAMLTFPALLATIVAPIGFIKNGRRGLFIAILSGVTTAVVIDVIFILYALSVLMHFY